MESHDIVDLFIVLGTAVILPITIIFLALRGKMIISVKGYHL